MSYSHYILVENGDSYTRVNIFCCDRCKTEISESDRYYQEKDTHYCNECSYLKGKTSSNLFLSSIGLSPGVFGSEITDNKIVVYQGKKPSEKTNKDYRANIQYKNWRKSVFERDLFTCQHCFNRGGELNAHHIKTFKDFVELRYELDNGLTLCVDCHRKVHKKRR